MISPELIDRSLSLSLINSSPNELIEIALPVTNLSPI